MMEGPHPRLRTAYDWRVLRGEAPWVPGGRPTPQEAARQAEHDAQRQDGLAELEGFVAAVARDNLPTLAEVKAAKPMRELPGGGLVPVDMPIVSGDPDADRDSAQAAELARLVKDMDGFAEEVIFNDLDGMARVLADQWQAIRRITQSNQPAGGQDA